VDEAIARISRQRTLEVRQRRLLCERVAPIAAVASASVPKYLGRLAKSATPRTIGLFLTAALHTQVYSDHWGTRCDVFDVPGMDKRGYLRPSSNATLAVHVFPADTLTLGRVFHRRTKAVAGVRRLVRDPEWGVNHASHFGFKSTG
jgi:hypothetical protein